MPAAKPKRNFFVHAFHTHRKSFSRATLTALVATAIDFSSLYVLVEFAHVYYVAATATAAFLGAITNFLLNKFWAFENQRRGFARQSVRYALVSASSLVLNTGLVFCFTEIGQLRYLTSKVVASVIVGWIWNYPLHRYFVFPTSKR